jgi:queuosine precursor transporter
MIVVISNIVSTKLILIPFFHNFSIPAGLITYPLTFFISDFITEIYGTKKAKEMVHHAFGMSIVAYLIIKIALILPSPTLENQSHFEEILGLNGIILVASLTAYIISQTIDIHLYAAIKKWTGPNYLWVRNNGSTLIAQLVDTTIVNLIYLKGGVGMDMVQIFPIMAFSYVYKCTFSIVLTPLFYFLIFLFKNRKVCQESQ